MISEVQNITDITMRTQERSPLEIKVRAKPELLEYRVLETPQEKPEAKVNTNEIFEECVTKNYRSNDNVSSTFIRTTIVGYPLGVWKLGENFLKKKSLRKWINIARS